MGERFPYSWAWYAELPSKLLTLIPSDFLPNILNNKKNSNHGFEQLQDPSDWTDTFEMQHFGTFTCLIPTGKREPGVGHRFSPIRLTTLDWCDKCGEFIWGLLSQAFRCENCHYTCHRRCLDLVTLDCRSESDTLSSRLTESTQLSNSTFYTCDLNSHVEPCGDIVDFVDCPEVCESEKSIYDLPANGDALKRMIDSYNETAFGLLMTMENEFSFNGFVKLLINFTRPVSTVDECEDKAVSFYDFVNDSPSETSSSLRRTLTSFYLPRNCVKTLHISSDTTTQEMIVSLLKKYHIADNPRKFALYERDLTAGHTLIAKLTKIPDDACPLRLALVWGSTTCKRFVLQENETGDIMWDSFELPELQNFLTILDIEEKQYIRRIYDYYVQYKKCIEYEINRKASGQWPRATLV